MVRKANSIFFRKDNYFEYDLTVPMKKKIVEDSIAYELMFIQSLSTYQMMMIKSLSSLYMLYRVAQDE